MDKEKFVKSAQALEELKTALEKLKQVAAVKKNALVQQRQSYKRNMAEKNAHLEAEGKKTEAVAARVAEVVKKIDMVLKDDGSDNNHD